MNTDLKATPSVSPDQHSWFPFDGIHDIRVHLWFKKGESREGKALAGFGPTGHSGNHIKSTQTTHVTRPKILKINWTTEL